MAFVLFQHQQQRQQLANLHTTGSHQLSLNNISGGLTMQANDRTPKWTFLRSHKSMLVGCHVHGFLEPGLCERNSKRDPPSS